MACVMHTCKSAMFFWSAAAEVACSAASSVLAFSSRSKQPVSAAISISCLQQMQDCTITLLWCYAGMTGFGLHSLAYVAGRPFHDTKQVPSSCTQALDVLAHSLMLCLGVVLFLEAKLVIEAVSDSPPKFLRY